MPWCPFAERIDSPNHSARPAGVSIVGAMQHSTVGAWDPSLAELTRPDASPVSAHFLIGLDGRIAQLVNTDRVSWAQMSCNDRFISIEHVDDGDHADPVRTPEQYAASAKVNRWIAERYGYEPSSSTIKPHRSCVQTACPSGLDLERIVYEVVAGGDMFDPRTRPGDLAFLDNRIREIVLGEPQLTGFAIGKIMKPYGGALGAAKKLAPKRLKRGRAPTRAQVRAGHGR